MIAPQPGALGSPSKVRPGGIFRVSLQGLSYLDPALGDGTGGVLLDTTCARLMAYPDKPPPEGFRLVPEVAAAFPRISPDGKTYTFKLRRGFRFSDGTRVRASAFARAINRMLAPAVNSPGAQYVGDIVGADAVLAGKATTAAGVVPRGNTLVVRFTRPVLDFAAKTTMHFFCAVPPTLPSDPEGVGAFPAAGPYYIKDYRPGERVIIRRNPYYGGKRPHHVDGFDVDLQAASPQEVLDRVERGEADWGFVIAPIYFEPGRQLVAKYGVNKTQFFVKPGLTLRHIPFNVSRPVFRNNPRLRQAVNFALDRRALGRVLSGSPLLERLTDQYLAPTIPGFRDADIYPLERPDLRRARKLARGNRRGGKVTLYAPDIPRPVAVAQLVKRQLAEIGLEVEVKPISASAYYPRLVAPDEPWDLALGAWGAAFIDPYTYINELFATPVSLGGGNVGHFASPTYRRLMRQATRIRGPRRYRVYGELDVRLARDAAPSAAISFLSEPTLVSKRVGCIVLRPVLDLTAACLR
jgi:peptide/nickel transport system substrate-binding protein/oligopeptide transport system substrate-binding protein